MSLFSLIKYKLFSEEGKDFVTLSNHNDTLGHTEEINKDRFVVKENADCLLIIDTNTGNDVDWIYKVKYDRPIDALNIAFHRCDTWNQEAKRNA